MPGENLPRQVWNRQTKFTYNHWLAALVKGKCTSTKPTCFATGVVCHPDTERNRPYKIPWSCRGLNWGPTAPHARTLPVCHYSKALQVLQSSSNLYFVSTVGKCPLLHLGGHYIITVVEQIKVKQVTIHRRIQWVRRKGARTPWV